MSRRGAYFTTTEVEVEVPWEDILDGLDDDDVRDLIADRGLAMTAVTEMTLEGIIEPFLPDSLEHPAKWLACDIAKAIRTFRERKVA